MAHQRYIDGKRVVHTRKLSEGRIEVTFPPATPGGPRIRETFSFDTYQKKVTYDGPGNPGPAAA